jgi:hypothetical protein
VSARGEDTDVIHVYVKREAVHSGQLVQIRFTWALEFNIGD